MLLLNTAKKCLKILGIIPVPQEYLPSKLRKYKDLINHIHLALVFILQLQYLSSVTYFFLVESKTIDKYRESVVLILCNIFILILCLILIWKRWQLITFMEDLELIIEKSKKEKLVNCII